VKYAISPFKADRGYDLTARVEIALAAARADPARPGPSALA
jgi:hypothetical protein